MKISISRLWLNPLSFILSSYYSILSWYGNFLQKIVDPERYALNEKVHDHLNNREYSIAAELWKHSGEIEKAADASFSGTLYFFDKYRMKKALWDDFAFLLSDTLKYYIDLKNFYAVKNISKFFLKFAMINDDRIGNLFFYFNNGLQRDYLLSEIIEEFCEENWDVILSKDFNWKHDFALDLLFKGNEYNYAQRLFHILEMESKNSNNDSYNNLKYFIDLCERKNELVNV